MGIEILIILSIWFSIGFVSGIIYQLYILNDDYIDELMIILTVGGPATLFLLFMGVLIKLTNKAIRIIRKRKIKC